MSEEDFADNVCQIQLVQLRETMVLIKRLENPLPGKIYRQLGVKLWGEGAYERESIDGCQTKYKTLSMVQEMDIVVNKIWARNGAVAVVPKDLSGCFVSGEFPIFSPVLEKLEPRWFHWLTKTKDFWRQCDEKSQGTSGKNRIRPEKFLEIEIPLPPVVEQRRIIARIEELAARIDEARELRRRAVEEADALMNKCSEYLFDNKDCNTRSIESVCEVKGGIQKSSERAPAANPRRYITVAHVQRNRIDISDPRYFEVSEEELEKWRLLPGDVLVIEGNGSADQIGRTALFCGEIDDCVHQNHVIRIRPNQTRILPDYLNGFLNSPLGQKEMRERSRTTSGLFNLSVGRIKSIDVPLPALNDQRLIVERIHDLQSKLDLLKRHQAETAAALDALLPAVLVRAFRGEL